MPTYEFRCKGCGHTVNVNAPLNKVIKTPQCLDCGIGLTRVYDFMKVNFKGSGFYSNDKKETE